MSDERVALIRKLVEAFNRLDIDAVIDDLDPSIELHEWPAAPGAQTYHGHDGAREALDSWFEIWEWMHVEVEDIIDAGDRALVRLHQRAKGNGSEIEVELTSFNVYTFRDRKVVAMQLFTEREPALQAAGLSPDKEEEKR